MLIPQLKSPLGENTQRTAQVRSDQHGAFHPPSRKTTAQDQERRRKHRFAVRRELRYQLKDGAKVESGAGETVDISSSGVSFSIGRQLSAGNFIELRVSWPVLPDVRCPTLLIVFGRVVRNDPGKCACTIDKYEFRRQTFHPAAPAAKAEQEPERRGKDRFTIQRELRYHLLQDGAKVESGVGETIDIGSRGVGFSIGRQLPAGNPIELSISWPVLLHDSCPLRLIAFGQVVRNDPGKCVCTIDNYEFRTQARTVTR
ncbi:MAG TPA: PilZ domain-containing protein [Candidatus Acidoferrales bacterium]|nr:PilZ domain-containing protein [Candidatus Acidoferrales bacterium]